VRVNMRRQAVVNELDVRAGKERVDSAHCIPECFRLGGLPIVDAFRSSDGPRAHPSRQNEHLLALIMSEVCKRDP
jgi:hypothetical protein